MRCVTNVAVTHMCIIVLVAMIVVAATVIMVMLGRPWRSSSVATMAVMVGWGWLVVAAVMAVPPEGCSAQGIEAGEPGPGSPVYESPVL